MMRRVFCLVNCSLRDVALLPCSRQTTLSCVRAAATYPSPAPCRSESRGNRKKYNFLSSERLVEKKKGPSNRRTIRLRDDVFFHRRVEFRETVKNSVEQHIRYFPENVKQYVFFRNKGGKVVSSGFHGMRKAPGFLSHRIVQFVENDVLKPENRAHLVEMIKSTGVTPPSKQEWVDYSDKKTGEININLFYFHKLEKQMQSFFVSRKMKPLQRMFQAFLLMNRNNFDVCPPMRMWSVRQGPIQDEELVERGSLKEVRDIEYELEDFQRLRVRRAFEALTEGEKMQTLAQAEARHVELRRAYERERLFSAKVMSGVAALKEVRAMTNPAITYHNQEYYKYLIKHGGSVEATLRRSKDEVPRWFTLPKEEKVKFYCFGCSAEMHPVAGAHLYLRYACRDYGFTREESMERWSTLSDLQKAALNFCFYAPISPQRRSSSAFRRFYVRECYRHGLVMTGKACGNRAFFLRVRKLWMSMNADERAQYEDTESFSSVFPLHPTSSSVKNKDSASPVGHVVVAAAAAAAGAPSSAVSATDDASSEAMNRNEVCYFEDEDLDGGNHDEDGVSDDKQGNVDLEAHVMMRSPGSKQLAFTI